MKTKNTIHPPITQEIKDKIIERWRYSPLNSIPQLSKEFNCQEKQVHNCINNYLASKIR